MTLEQKNLQKRIQLMLDDEGLFRAKSCERLDIAFGTTIGEVRKENQDTVAVVHGTGPREQNNFVLALVCDGIAGLPNGRLAAHFTLSSFVAQLVLEAKPVDSGSLENILEATNVAVSDALKGDGGATIAGVLIGVSETNAFSVGDSRVYQLPDHGKPKQITRDDTLAAILMEMGKAPAVLDDIGVSKQLAQYVGQSVPLSPQIISLDLQSENCLLLGTDGLNLVPTSLVSKIVKLSPTRVVAVDRILKLSRWLGGLDNASIVLVGPRVKPQNATSSKEFTLHSVGITHSFSYANGTHSELPLPSERPPGVPFSQSSKDRKPSRRKKRQDLKKVSSSTLSPGVLELEYVPEPSPVSVENDSEVKED